jgi:hypothetical protein
MKKLDDVSTRELLETLRRRHGQHGPAPDDHLAADADHLLSCVGGEILDYPYVLPAVAP